ncbi:MAG: transcriptional repressor [Desulfobacterales bacterium]
MQSTSPESDAPADRYFQNTGHGRKSIRPQMKFFRKFSRNSPISFDTVNRTLLTFAEIGIVDLAEGHGTPRRFDTNLVPHHHFFCIKCGRLTDFICKAYDNLEIPEKIKENFTITSKRVVLKGICDACRSLNKT